MTQMGHFFVKFRSVWKSSGRWRENEERKGPKTGDF
jgi:hypothetical protein